MLRYRPLIAGGLVILVPALLLVLIVLSGCDRRDEEDPQKTMVETLSRQLRSREAELALLKEDYNGIVLVLLAFAGGTVGLILLVAKEHRSRRVLARLFRILLNRLGKEESG